jgi:hypothetical protein
MVKEQQMAAIRELSAAEVSSGCENGSFRFISGTHFEVPCTTPGKKTHALRITHPSILAQQFKY